MLNRDGKKGEVLKNFGLFFIAIVILVGVTGIVKPGHERGTRSTNIVKPGH